MNLNRLSKRDLIYMATHRCEHRHTYLQHPQCLAVAKPARRAFFDIETYGLTADFGVLLTWSLKAEGESKIQTGTFQRADLARTKPGQEDFFVVRACTRALAEFDEIVTFYGNDYRFDVPFVRTRAVAMRIPFPQYGDLKQVDLYPIMKKKFRMSRNSLENSVRTLIGQTEKTHIAGAIWRAALRGDPKAIGWILDHNKRDVRDTERLWKAIIDFQTGRGGSI